MYFINAAVSCFYLESSAADTLAQAAAAVVMRSVSGWWRSGSLAAKEDSQGVQASCYKKRRAVSDVCMVK
jgi:hypothetical protein